MIDVLQQDLVMRQGSRFEQPVIVKENGAVKDLTGYTARMQVRQFKDDDTILADYTTGNNKIVLTPTSGRVTILVPGSVTAGYDFGDAWYDLEIVDGAGEPIRIMEGRISLSREVTR